MSVKVVAAVHSMNRQGHFARLVRHKGEMWVEIDRTMLATFGEIEELVEGTHSFDSMSATFTERYTKEFGPS